MEVLVRSVTLPYTLPDGEFIEKAKKVIRGVIAPKYIKGGEIYKRSVDARKKNNICFVCSVLLYIEDGIKINENELKAHDSVILENGSLEISYGSEAANGRPVIIGFGPAGIFCGMLLAENGYRPIILERGDCVSKRKEAVDRFYNTGILDTNSNIQFGAGGAGTFSDGKLMTRINDSKCRFVLEKFVSLGATEDILKKSKPHIGTDRLLGVVENADRYIKSLGGEIFYNTTAGRFISDNEKITAVKTNNGEINCSCVILATGHSARDTYSYLLQNNYTLENKPFSVGVRIEHLQSDIDKALFGSYAGDVRLGHGEYALSRRENGRGVYTFCMCPGGEVVAAASEENRVVTNGMSRYARDGINANAAIAVDVCPENPMQFQRMLEEKAFAAGGRNYNAPVQTLGDFLSDVAVHSPSRVLPSYMGGNHYNVCGISSLLPKDIYDMISLGIADFGKKIHGFDSPDAVLTGFETRTSAPYRLKRDENRLSVDCINLYPCGEGAGYAGGITSAAVDGLSVAMEIMKKYKAY